VFGFSDFPIEVADRPTRQYNLYMQEASGIYAMLSCTHRNIARVVEAFVRATLRLIAS